MIVGEPYHAQRDRDFDRLRTGDHKSQPDVFSAPSARAPGLSVEPIPPPKNKSRRPHRPATPHRTPSLLTPAGLQLPCQKYRPEFPATENCASRLPTPGFLPPGFSVP